MKKILFAVCFWALLAGLTSSCSKETHPGDDEFTVTATIAGNDTKVSYSEDGSTHKLQPSWQSGDKIIGFDGAGNTYCYQVRGSSGKTASFELVKTGEYAGTGTVNPDDGTVMYMIYDPGAKATNISNKSLTFRWIQDQTDPIPAIMTAKATVANRCLSLEFTNRTAIVGIKSPRMAKANHTYSSIKLSGDLVKSRYDIVIDGGDFQVNFDSANKYIEKTFNFTSNASKQVNGDFYFAVPPIPSLAVLTFTTDNDECFKVSATSLEAGRYYYIDNPTFGEDNSIPLEFGTLTQGENL